MRRKLAPLLAALAFALGCSEDPSAPAADGPLGALLSARRDELARLLDRLAPLEGTPLGRRAQELRARLPECELLEAHAAAADLDALLDALRCGDGAGSLAGIHDQRGDAALAFAWPLGQGLRLRGRLVLDAQDQVDLELRIPPQAVSGASGLLLPGADPAGAGVLSGSQTLLQARLRPAGGLDLGSLVAAGGQADQLFRLKSDLFAGAVLDGSWEAAIYLPDSGRQVPPAALALGFTSRPLAVAAMERFVDELQATWSLRRSFFQVGDASGACLLELRILPEFAPCYVATDRALVVGYDPVSVRKALDGAPAALGEAGGLLIELARIPEADARLAGHADARLAGHADARLAGGAPRAQRSHPWQRLRVQGAGDGRQVRLHLRLESGAGV